MLAALRGELPERIYNTEGVDEVAGALRRQIVAAGAEADDGDILRARECRKSQRRMRARSLDRLGRRPLGVDTTHLTSGTFMNNGFNHSEELRIDGAIQR